MPVRAEGKDLLAGAREWENLDQERRRLEHEFVVEVRMRLFTVLLARPRQIRVEVDLETAFWLMLHEQEVVGAGGIEAVPLLV